MIITLHTWTPADKPALMALCNAVDRTFLSDRLPYPYTEADADWWLGMVAENDGKEGVWRSIVLDGQIVGSISVERMADEQRNVGSIGYMLLTPFWSQGIGTEAVRQICGIAYRELALERIIGEVFPENLASARVLGPGAFTPNMIDVWAYDVEKGDSRVFKVMRIHSVEATETPWAFEDKHEVKKPDVFRMTGSPVEKVVLQLNTSAKSLLLEEFPLAEKDIKREDGKWILRTVIHSLEGAGRFVIGLAADVKILEGEALRKYILDYQKKYIQKL